MRVYRAHDAEALGRDRLERACAPAAPRGGARRAIRRIAVLDLGSTSFHLLVADAAPDGEIEVVMRERVLLRLADAAARDDRIPQALCERAIGTATRMGRSAAQCGAEQILPVATATLRQAVNGPELADRMAAAIGVPVRVLSGRAEARAIHTAVSRRVPVAATPSLTLDLGGGSLELALGDVGGCVFEASVPLGVARLRGSLTRHDPPQADELAAVAARVREELLPLRASLREVAPASAVVSGGTARALARVQLGDADAPNPALCGFPLDAAALAALTTRLLAAGAAQRRRIAGLRGRRSELIPLGALILHTTCGVLGLDGFRVSDWGLREGIVLEALARTPA